MRLLVNGQPHELPDSDTPLTVRALLDHLDLAHAAVAVELNRQLVPKRRHDQTPLRDGDRLELVTLVGGG